MVIQVFLPKNVISENGRAKVLVSAGEKAFFKLKKSLL